MTDARRFCFFVVVTIAVLFDPKASRLRRANASSTDAEDVNISAILDSLSSGYDKRVRPNYGGQSVEVGVSMYVLSISKLSEVEMDFTVDFYFRQTWQDPRLAFKAEQGVETLSVGSEFIRNLWVPDTFFVNEKKSYFHTATTSNEFLRIMANGDVFRSIRLTITASCPMDLQYFPMDRQLCHIEIESFGYTMRDIRYKWLDGAKSIGIALDVELSHFRVLGYRQKTTEINLSTGNYSRLACEIQFVRSMGYYMIQIYIPSSLIVVISWVSFWLNRNATPARVSLGVTTVLTMTTLMSSTNAALPKISYVKSIDVYLGTCFIMVFASLLEYATVGYIDKRIQLRKSRFAVVQKLAEQARAATALMMGGAAAAAAHAHAQDAADQGPNMDRPNGWRSSPSNTATLPQPFRGPHSRQWANTSYQDVRIQVHDTKPYSKSMRMDSSQSLREDDNGELYRPTSSSHSGLTPQKVDKLCGVTPSDIDKYSRILFPVCFVCFNLSYWIIYLHISDVLPDDLVMLKEE